jgi:hypothetical protein
VKEGEAGSKPGGHVRFAAMSRGLLPVRVMVRLVHFMLAVHVYLLSQRLFVLHCSLIVEPWMAPPSVDQQSLISPQRFEEDEKAMFHSCLQYQKE